MTEKTLDLTHALSVVLIGVDTDAAAACAKAVRPIHVVSCTGVTDGSAEVARRRPLVVVLGAVEPQDEATIREVSIACGAEVVTPSTFADAASLARVLLDALRVADKRRIAR